ncbi:MAG TPA: hypothetical protein VFN78_05280 [Ktedonobacterales bacterium]|nr:hypothetical protein [Ktedonobacterales bacterium]
MEEQRRASEANETPSVMGSVGGAAAAPSVQPDSQPAGQGGQGDLRPIWPVGERGRGARLSRRYALFARLAATACALLFFYVAWSPLANAITSGDLRNGPTGPIYRFSLTAGELGAPPLYGLYGGQFFGVWSGLTVVGLLLSPLLWQTSLRWLRWPAIALYACWLAAICAISVGAAQLILVTIPDYLRQGAGPYQVTLHSYSGMPVAIYSIAPAFGLWLALVAALLGIGAAALAIMALVTRRRATVPITPTVQGEIVTLGEAAPTRSIPGAGAITGGLILWAWGFFLLPWATVNCAQAPLLLGSCQGLPVASALQIGLGAARTVFDPTAGLYAITGMLLTGALLILVAVWRRDITRTLCVWASLWLALALGCAVLAISGAQQVVANAPSVGLPTGDWRGDTGVLIVFLALLLVAIGLIPLWAVAVRTTQRLAAAQRAAGL